MSQIVSWEYYDSLHLETTVTTDTFPTYEKLAEMEVREVIGPIRWAEIDNNTYGYAILKDCICKVIDKMVADENSAKGTGITSVSNDGYTESYAVQTSVDLKKEMTTSIRQWLSGTGLVGAY